MKQFNLCVLLLLLATTAFAQSRMGAWTDYLSYSSAHQVIKGNGKIYCVTTGGLFTYNEADNSIQKLNQINGLSDVNPSVVAYGEEGDVVLVAYENSNLDLLHENGVFNLSDIKRKQMQGDKKVYNSLVVGQTAYLSCGFGIVAVNLEKREIKDTYYIGDGGSQVTVFDMAFDGTYLYAATDEGIFVADINAPNLQDFQYWVKVESIPHANQKFAQLELYNGNIIAGYDGGENNQELYRKDGDLWERFLPAVTSVKGLQASGDRLSISMGNQVLVYDTNGELVDKADNYFTAGEQVYGLNAQNAIADGGVLWVADAYNGLVKKNGGTYELANPQGPPNNRVFSMTANGSDLWVAAGGRDETWNNVFYLPQALRYQNGVWQEFSYKNYPELNEFHDIVNITVDPRDPEHVFMGCWGAGILEFQGSQLVKRHDQFNSSLQTALPTDPHPHFVRIGGMAFDSKFNLWATNAKVSKPLSVLSPDGNWEAFELEGIPNDYDVGNLVIAENDDLWMTVPRFDRGLFVRKADGSDGRRLQVVSYFNNGQDESFTQMSDVYAIAKDMDGAVWVGTSAGVAVYFNPEEIWETNPFYATQPGLDLNDGVYHPLLSTEMITAIAVDGANRKWFGTRNSGVFLVSEDGQQEIENFNESNSPLLSNSVSSIAINDKTGEVFFGTPEGIISYRGAATAGLGDYADVYAFPNPVRPDYDGDIVITGLIEDTDVKITDISGNLVHKTTSLGGQAIWNGKNLNGNRVSTGVYMVFGNDKQGEKTFTTKILFIH
jgi:hypothetical protein